MNRGTNHMRTLVTIFTVMSAIGPVAGNKVKILRIRNHRNIVLPARNLLKTLLPRFREGKSGMSKKIAAKDNPGRSKRLNGSTRIYV
mmetsp:Transcript_389/g.627  ORF Transcript_389/g.627 Transcript_389/m.627 type:complete len:87 (+) Transcript_389:425-685(+)